MVRKALWSLAVALIGLTLLAMSVRAQEGIAQSGEVGSAITVQPDVAAANVVQTVPITLTLTIPGPTGPITIQVPVFLTLNIRIGISPDLTTTLEVTPSVVTEGGTPPLVTIESTQESTPESPAEGTVETPTRAPTVTPTPITPTPVPPTATPLAIATESTNAEPTAAEPTEAPLPTATPTPAETPAPEVIAPLCPDPRSVIVSPGVGQTLSEMANIFGTATHENFGYYKVEYASGANIDADGDYAYLGGGNTQVTGGLLATFDSTTLVNGAYTLKLTVVDKVGNFPPPCTVSVMVEN